VGQGRQVAGAAERAVLGDHRGDAPVQERGQRLGGLGADAGATGGKGAQPQQHHRPDEIPLHRRPHPDRVRAHQAALEARAHGRVDVPQRQRAEAGGDAVDGALGGRQRLDAGPAAPQAVVRRPAEGDAGAAASDRQHVGGAERIAGDQDGRHGSGRYRYVEIAVPRR
jgi:hypothetical protein